MDNKAHKTIMPTKLPVFVTDMLDAINTGAAQGTIKCDNGTEITWHNNSSSNASDLFPTINNPAQPYGAQFTPSDIKNHLDNNFYTRTRKIKIDLSLETFKYIRQFTQRHCTIEIYNNHDDQNALLTNRAIIELMIELMDKLNKKMQTLKPTMSITFTIPQAWAFTEIYSAIDVETMNEYTFATIQPIVDTFNQQLL